MIRTLTFVAAIGAGLGAGVFFAFSSFVMKGLRDLPDSEGLSAMQAVNKAAPSPLLVTALFGTAVVCVVVAISALTRLDEPYGRYQLIGSVLYVAGIVLTIAYHIPRNDALGLVDPNGAGAAAEWVTYARNWTAWNHVRTLTSLAGAVVLTLAVRAA